MFDDIKKIIPAVVRISVILTVVTHAILVVQAQAEPVVSTVFINKETDLPPYIWYDRKKEKFDGVNIYVVEKVAKSLGWDLTLVDSDYTSPTVFQSLMNDFNTGRIDFGRGWLKLPDSPDFIIYGEHPISVMETKVYTKKEKHFHYQSWESLIGRKGVVIDNHRVGERISGDTRFNQFAKDHQFDLVVVNTMDEFFKAILSEKVDYGLAFEYVVEGLSFANPGRYQKLLQSDKSVVSTNIFPVFSHKSKILKDLPEFNKKMRDIAASGEVAHYTRLYMQLYLNYIETPAFTRPK